MNAAGPPADAGGTPGVAVDVRFFAQLRTATGVGETRVTLPAGATVRQLADHLEATYDGLRLTGSMCAVDEAYAAPDTPLAGGETVAFLPPVSGG